MQDTTKRIPGGPSSGEIAELNRFLDRANPQDEQRIMAAAAELVRPMVEAMAKLLTGNAEALRQITDALDMQNERMTALERTIKKRIRRWFPKGTDFGKVTHKEVQVVEDWMNDYPRRILGFKTSRQLFNTEVSLILT